MNTKRVEADHYVYDNSYVFEVHDSAIQALYGIGLKLEYCMSQIDEAPGEAKTGIDAAIVTIGDLIERIRLLMRDE